MFPQSEGKESHYVAIGDWNLLGRLDEDWTTPKQSAFGWLREGFEPSTFGL
jgi:hypothetical protein